MPRLTVTTTIPAARDAVWEDVARLETHGQWMSDVVDMTIGGTAPYGVGTTMEVLTRVGPFRTNDLMTVTEWDPPSVIGVAHRGLVSGTGRFVLEPVEEGTRFTWDEELRFPWYLGGALTARLARPVLGRIWAANLRRLAERF